MFCYSGTSRQIGTSRVSNKFQSDPSFALDYLENIRSRRKSPKTCGGFCFRVKKILDPQRPFRNLIFFILGVIAISVDPLFFYIPVVNDDKKCLRLDKALGTTIIAIRSVLDLFYIIYIILRLRISSLLAGNLHKTVRESAIKYFMGFFTIDLVAILPLPQVVILIIPTTRGTTFLNATNLFKYFVIFQYVPRIIRIYPFFTKVRRNSDILPGATWPKAVFNLLLYMLAGHVFGALWYFFAIARLTTCWNKFCVNHNGCEHSSFYCHDNLGDYKFLNDFCSLRTGNTMIFNFGIFQDAPQSGIVEVMDFPQKFFHSFQWGLQNLSGFGQNLQTSSYVWENIFAVFITISGLVLFLFLIGNIQIYLQSKTMRSEEMRLKLREIEQWMPYQKLSKDLQQQVKKHQGYVWRETRGVDVENFLNTLPKNLKRNINRELFSHVLQRVPMFSDWNEQILSEMCDSLKQVLYTAESYIQQEGDPVSEMFFITRGQLLTMKTTNRKRTGVYLQAGDFFGEELLMWALETQSSSENLPISTRTVRTLTEVEGLALMADDLKFAASRFRQMNGEQLEHILRFYAPEWRTWAASFIQAAWRRYIERKLKESMRGEINRLPDSSPSLGATIYASRFAATTLRATRRIGTRAFTGESSCHDNSEVSAEEQ
ncbi:hypothetical protein CUMW_269560 [Citrus unshiu]|uniref:Cyclic nucleotide-binding domain-containing protein n=1 Tax=Citrus unshiu TaxID=55188 RepID=A0A2H5QWW7_CITUN|nr:hypothetical protein CUMW_269560 [Citrus unshiu]